MYEFTINYTDGRVSTVTVEQQDFVDQLGYCREGIAGEWITEFTYESIKEEW